MVLILLLSVLLAARMGLTGLLRDKERWPGLPSPGKRVFHGAHTTERKPPDFIKPGGRFFCDV